MASLTMHMLIGHLWGNFLKITKASIYIQHTRISLATTVLIIFLEKKKLYNCKDLKYSLIHVFLA